MPLALRVLRIFSFLPPSSSSAAVAGTLRAFASQRAKVSPLPLLRMNSTVADPNSKNALKKAQKEADRLARKAAKGSPSPSAPQPARDKKLAPKPSTTTTTVAEEDLLPHYPPVAPGEKKDLSLPMSKTYNPSQVELSWQSWWEAQKFFAPAVDAHGKPNGLSGETFVIPAPPPNVTGALHIGHGLTVSLQDALIRWKRMTGASTLWLPGFDHAGIATQSVVEKRIFKDTGKTRHDFTREDFVAKIWDWKDVYQQKISDQLRLLGASYDWDRVAFTMNENLCAAVTETFCQLHEDGILYRGTRLVNWCTHLRTSLSNIEVDDLNLKKRTLVTVPGYSEKVEVGVITSFKYPIENSDEFIVVATTRPETLLGDTGIAVHPDDPRYTHLVGKFATNPFIPGRKMPIFADAEAVKMQEGTGAVKITPAHDLKDFETGLRNKLDVINILNDDGTFNSNAGPIYAGQKRFTVRRAIVADLKERGLFVESKDHEMNIPICSRSGDIIEYIVKPQWWINCQGMASDVLKRTDAGELEILPSSAKASWYRWLENMQDWCISRQLWWGHRCPAYFVRIEGVDQVNESDFWVVGRNLEEATERATRLAGDRPFKLEQDPDVLDTWFSSGLWPFSIMGWPKKTADLEHFYPNSVLETGIDIIFFWVARMAMLGTKLTGKMPFKQVYFHGIVRDGDGEKMSKSKGNVINPSDVIEGIPLEALIDQVKAGNFSDAELKKAIAEKTKAFPKGIPVCGADAMRFTLCSMTTGADVNMDIARVEMFRKFGNKIWNATRFGLMHKFPENYVPPASSKPTGRESMAERWLLDRLNTASADINRSLDQRLFKEATEAVHRFWLYEFCDVYIEASKALIDLNDDLEAKLSAQNTLYTALESGMRMLHPFMPFVTEELWQRLPRRPECAYESITQAAFPTPSPDCEFPEARLHFDAAMETVKTARYLSTQYNLTKGIRIFVQSNDMAAEIRSQSLIMKSLIKGCDSYEVMAEADIPQGCALELINSNLKVHLLVKGLVDTQAEIKKIEKRMALSKLNLETTIRGTQAADYETKVKKTTKDATFAKISEINAEIGELQKAIAAFKILE